MRDLKEVLEQNKEKYIEELKNLVGIDTHDLGHGIDGGLEKQGQAYGKPASGSDAGDVYPGGCGNY